MGKTSGLMSSDGLMCVGQPMVNILSRRSPLSPFPHGLLYLARFLVCLFHPTSIGSKVVVVLSEEVVAQGFKEVVREERLSKDDDLAIMTYGDVVLESFKQLEEGETKTSPDRPFTQVEMDLGKCDDFSFVTLQQRELVIDHGNGRVVTTPNLFGNPTDLGEVDSQRQEFVNVILRLFLVGLVTPGVMWKWGRFDFAPHVVVKQFVSGSLTDPRYDVSMKVRVLFWVILMPSDCIPTFLVDFSLWRYEGVLFSHPREADLVEFLVLDNWFTWTSKMHGSDMLRRLDYISCRMVMTFIFVPLCYGDGGVDCEAASVLADSMGFALDHLHVPNMPTKVSRKGMLEVI
ncbi:uncharacterized protein E5676_scaffold180G00590 [Cucumis melo var. makuwa]|uniref:Uncharacterized protein n=1 Tax=Cucumis melo var. makuwa TaxID=1194695 RepID=A0A5D3BGG3_CUCMM|nr:uncharacterized protein E5676_scaffold180G00590 [Cucumis melo var. makuwa]